MEKLESPLTKFLKGKSYIRKCNTVSNLNYWPVCILLQRLKENCFNFKVAMENIATHIFMQIIES